MVILLTHHCHVEARRVEITAVFWSFDRPVKVSKFVVLLCEKHVLNAELYNRLSALWARLRVVVGGRAVLVEALFADVYGAFVEPSNGHINVPCTLESDKIAKRVHFGMHHFRSTSLEGL